MISKVTQLVLWSWCQLRNSRPCVRLFCYETHQCSRSFIITGSAGYGLRKFGSWWSRLCFDRDEMNHELWETKCLANLRLLNLESSTPGDSAHEDAEDAGEQTRLLNWYDCWMIEPVACYQRRSGCWQKGASGLRGCYASTDDSVTRVRGRENFNMKLIYYSCGQKGHKDLELSEASGGTETTDDAAASVRAAHIKMQTAARQWDSETVRRGEASGWWRGQHVGFHGGRRSVSRVKQKHLVFDSGATKHIVTAELADGEKTSVNLRDAEDRQWTWWYITIYDMMLMEEVMSKHFHRTFSQQPAKERLLRQRRYDRLFTWTHLQVMLMSEMTATVNHGMKSASL